MARPNVSPPDLEINLMQEETREYIAWIALGGLFATLFVVVIGGWLVLRTSAQETLQILTATMSVLAGIVGAVVGYYFRSES